MRTIVFFLGLLLAFGVAQAEMLWMGLNPTPQGGNAGDSGQIITDARQYQLGSFNGFEIEIKVVDSSAGDISDDSSKATFYTQTINTEDVVSATGLFQVVSITDTSTTAGHLMAIGGDSTFVWYTLKTGYIPYDPDAQTLVTAAAVTTVSGTAVRTPVTLSGKTEDTLFKPFTWFEFTLCDSTRWGEKFTQDFDSSGSATLDDGTVAGTYTGSGELGRYHLTIYGAAADDPDSFIWIHYGNQGHVTSCETTAMTGSAQDLDSGMTIEWNATTGHADDDAFVFHVSDSLHYGKTVRYEIRAGLNVHRRR